MVRCQSILVAAFAGAYGKILGARLRRRILASDLRRRRFKRKK